MTRVLIHNDQTTALTDRLTVAAPDVSFTACNTYADLPDALQSFQPDIVYTVRFAGTPDYPRDALFGDRGPRWIANGGVGIDHFGHWDPEKTTVTNAAGVAADMMAEYVLGGFLHISLDIPGLKRDQANKVWTPRQVVPLKGKTLLILGLGHTGRALAGRAKAFGMAVIGTRANPQPTPFVDQVAAATDLHRLLPKADAIAVCTPLTPETRHLIGAREIARMKPGVLFADVSRGGVVDQIALAEALASGQIRGAALDVFETEPLPPDSPFWDMDNVVVSPHCSSVYEGWELASFDLFLRNLVRWQSGQPLFNIVNPMRGY